MPADRHALRVIRGGAYGAREVLEAMFRRYGGTVYGRALLLLQDPALAEDVVSEVFADLVADAEGLRAAPSALGRVLYITTRMCLSHLHARPAEEQRPRRPLGLVRTQKEFGRDELLEAVRDVLPDVDLDTRVAAVLFHIDEMAVPEIAALTNVREGAVEKRLRTFNERLRRANALAPTPDDQPLFLRSRDAICSAWHQRRAFVRELPDAEAESHRRHALACTHCRLLTREFDVERSQVLSNVALEPLLRRLDRTEKPRQGRWARRMSVALMAAAALFALGILVGVLFLERSVPSGPPRFMLIAQNERGGRRPVPDGGALFPDEQLGFAVGASARRYLTILSVDAKGEVTPQVPEAGQSLSFSEWSHDALEAARVSDGAHRFIAIFSEAPLSMTQAINAAHRSFQRAGSLAEMRPLDVPGDQLSAMVVNVPREAMRTTPPATTEPPAAAVPGP